MSIDYTKLAYRDWRHHARYRNFVSAMKHKLPCQACGGAGGEVEPVLDFGEGPFFPCGWCEGTGLMTPHNRGYWLRCQKAKPIQPA